MLSLLRSEKVLRWEKSFKELNYPYSFYSFLSLLIRNQHWQCLESIVVVGDLSRSVAYRLVGCQLTGGENSVFREKRVKTCYMERETVKREMMRQWS